MLELRPSCECCDKDLLADQQGAYICSFECTFCQDCADRLLRSICPNCGGELLPRPRRALSRLLHTPAATHRVLQSGLYQRLTQQQN